MNRKGVEDFKKELKDFNQEDLGSIIDYANEIYCLNEERSKNLSEVNDEN